MCVYDVIKSMVIWITLPRDIFDEFPNIKVISLKIISKVVKFSSIYCSSWSPVGKGFGKHQTDIEKNVSDKLNIHAYMLH